MSRLLTRNGASPRRLAPVGELFAHISQARAFYAGLVASGKVNDVLTLGQGFFARSIEERLRSAGVLSENAQLAAQAHALAGSLFALLDWWIDHGMKRSPEECSLCEETVYGSYLAPTAAGWLRSALRGPAQTGAAIAARQSTGPVSGLYA